VLVLKGENCDSVEVPYQLKPVTQHDRQEGEAPEQQQQGYPLELLYDTPVGLITFG
jgi:hypothetical protein